MSENTEGANQPGIIGELERARELVAKLRVLLKPGRGEEELAGEAMDALSRALELLRISQGEAASGRLAGIKIEVSDSHQLHPHPASSPSHSVGSEESSQYGRRRKSPERKTGHRRRSHPYAVRDVASATLDDGHTWRKYGQKDIQNSNCPRSYYRCTHKFSRGCQAIRQVQKREDDPDVYFITYFGEHTCNLAPAPQQQQQLPPRSEIINFARESAPVLKKEIITSDSVKRGVEPMNDVGKGFHSQRDAVSKPSAPAARSPEFCGSVGVEQGDSSSGESSCMSDVGYQDLEYIDDTFFDLSSLFPAEQHEFSIFLSS